MLPARGAYGIRPVNNFPIDRCHAAHSSGVLQNAPTPCGATPKAAKP